MKTKLNDLFDQIEPEKGNKLDDKIQVKQKKECEIYSLLKKLEDNSEFNANYFYQEKLPEFSSKDITQFTLSLKNFDKKFPPYLGEFIDSLIQNSPDNVHKIYLENVSYEFDNIGFKNSKEITILGNTRYSLGSKMEKGILNAFGNSVQVGYKMKGGKINIHGNIDICGFVMRGGKIEINKGYVIDLAPFMQGGEIILNGDVKQEVGAAMRGGKVQINGNINSISNIIGGGNIYHYDKQIVKNGQILDESYI